METFLEILKCVSAVFVAVFPAYIEWQKEKNVLARRSPTPQKRRR
jgi:hypothetical protein